MRQELLRLVRQRLALKRRLAVPPSALRASSAWQPDAPKPRQRAVLRCRAPAGEMKLLRKQRGRHMLPGVAARQILLVAVRLAETQVLRRAMGALEAKLLLLSAVLTCVLTSDLPAMLLQMIELALLIGARVAHAAAAMRDSAGLIW